MSASNPRAASTSRNSASRASRPTSRSATRSRSISSAWKTRTARHRCRARRRGARRPGPSSRSRFQGNERVTGVIYGRVKGGFTVDLNGAGAFLPGSQVDIRPVRDITPLLGTPQPFQILKMDRSRGNIVVSRRAVLEESRAEAALGAGRLAQGRPDPHRRRQEHHRLRRLRRSRRRRRPAARHRHRLAPHQPSVRGAAYRPDGQGPGHPLQPRDAAHLARHEAARGRSVGGRRAQVPGGRPLQGPRHQHHRLRRVRRAGARRRGPRPRLRDELDQEERASRQDRLDQPGGRGHGARCRSAEAAHQPRPQADPGQSVGRLRRAAPGRHRARGRGQEHHRVRPVRRPARRDRRHGPSLRPRLAPLGRGGDRRLQEGRHRQGQGARRRCREGAHQPRHQAARQRSVRREHLRS